MELALYGGSPIRDKGWPQWPQKNPEMKILLDRVLESGDWSGHNTIVKDFEEKWSGYNGVRHSLCCCNGTVSLELILRALNIGRGDEVIIPCYTFVATASAVTAVGATPVFADIDGDSYQISADSIERNITSLTKAVIGVHIGGCPFDFNKVNAVVKKHGLYLIEDAAQAHGAEWQGHRVGSLGIAGSFSFQASKNISGGEGGMITTNDNTLYARIKKIRDNSSEIISTNGRLGAWQAAILTTQLPTADEYIKRRTDNAAYLDKRLNELGFVSPMKMSEKITKNAYHLYQFKYFSEECRGLSRSTFLNALNAEGINAGPGYSQMIHTMGVFKSPYFYKVTGTKRCYEDASLDLPEGKKAAYEEGCWMYMNHLMGAESDVEDIAKAMEKVYDNAEILIKEGK
ncbi:MAG: Aminotransferase DegT [Clostridia bacterium]|jgi:dTDP-4-amino-4,6-dideoxygalactose transaminase|nr:Aminotransferase DegT [Clostridia bacterium]